MAKSTDKFYRNLVMYSVFVRNYSEEGTFDAVRRDLTRIRNLGTDIVWLLPIHPIGKVGRKGTLGSPYAIQDYRKINPEYGTMKDFRTLVDAIHAQGMKCIIDVVYNHTSPDSWLCRNHPEWFYHRTDGSFGNKIGAWADVVDLDYTQPGLWDYQIDTLKQWAQIVDGFRCDVAPLIPLDFWLRAREEVEEVRPGCFWLSESVEPAFIAENRARGFVGLSDSEILQAFDACYDYDIFSYFTGYLEGRNSLKEYAARINQQETIYPDNYVKLRYLENHDNARAKFIIPDENMLMNWTAFLYFQKGMTLLYAGEEKEAEHLPSLFEKDAVRWEMGSDLSGFLSRLYAIKKHPLMADGSYQVRAFPRDILVAVYRSGRNRLVGIFSVQGKSSVLRLEIPDGNYRNLDGNYRNLIDGTPFEIYGGKVVCKGKPMIFEAEIE